MVVWVNDPEKKIVVVGNAGFVWWTSDRVFCARFKEPQESPVQAFRIFWKESSGPSLKGTVRGYDASAVTHSSLIRFVRTGLFPT